MNIFFCIVKKTKCQYDEFCQKKSGMEIVNPLAQNEGIECGYVRYYSSNLDSDKYWYESYLKVRRLLLTTE